jgi:CTLH/CRA C-terminal to LisH motif domain
MQMVMKFVDQTERMIRPASLMRCYTKLTLGEVDVLPTILLLYLISLQLRLLDIQINILSGRIDDAVDLLNSNFPSTLSSSTSSNGDTETPTPRVENSKLTLVKTVLPFTVEPAHLYLELRILAFVEASRTKPLPYEPLRPPNSDPELSPRISPSNNLRDPSGEPDGDVHLSRLLNHVYELYDCSQALQDPHERAEYQHELSAVSSLLAYKVPEQSPMAKYLSQERRQMVADEINSAILCMSPFQSRPSRC